MDSQPVRKEPAGQDEDLLRDIREDYSYFRDFWRENHEEAKIDLRFVSGDPWDPDDRMLREDNNRPVLSPDELDQYLNATINNLRQNKRAIKVNPKGSGANDKDAERRSAIIRGIEYASNAQSAYTNAFECSINCGMGFFRVTTKIISKENEVEPRIKIIENPLSVLLDPNALEADFSDQKRCFVMNVVRQRDFKKKYPKAERTDFTADDMTAAPDWISAQNIMVAEYWRIDDYDENGDGGTVTQYITNGVEILERNKWAGSWIPIIPVTGKKVYVPAGGEMKRMYYSMIRKARGPQMMLAYIASQEAEEYGMAPRAPVIGYVGQFETDKEAWDSLNRVPRSYIQVDPIVDGANSILPLPQRSPFSPNASAYEIGFERWRRSIQSAMGITPLPTAAQRQNEKSGVALDKIQSQQAIGSFHFTDNFDRAIENAGRQLDELITEVMDTPRQVGTRAPDDSHQLMHVIPGGQPPQQQPGEPPVDPKDVFDPTKGDFGVTISTGMSYQSQREEASAFVDLLVQNIGELPIPPQAKATLLARAVSLKDIGPIGDELAKILDPQGDGEPLPPQAQQAIADLQKQLQAAHQAGLEMSQKNSELEFDKKAQITKNQGEFAITKLKIEAGVAEAEITTKAQNLSERMEFIGDLVKQLVDHNHQQAMQSAGAQQQQDAQAQQAATQSQQSAQDAQQGQDAQVNQAALQPPSEQ